VARRGARLTFRTDDLGFDLALMEDDAPAPMPPWFHFGRKLASAGAVRALHVSMHVAGVGIAQPLDEDEAFASFRALDPDRHPIEFYWEEPDAPVD
jgi:hypothetical protein